MPKPWIVRPLVLDAGGTKYEVQPISYADGLTLVAVGNGDSEDITPESPDEVLYRLCMGPTWQQMLDAGCPYPVMVRGGLAAVQFQSALVAGIDCDTAVQIGESVWESGIDPEMLAAILTAANPKQPETSTPSTSTASASKTPSRASTRATTSRTGTQPTGLKAKPARSRGKASSSTSPSS